MGGVREPVRDPTAGPRRQEPQQRQAPPLLAPNLVRAGGFSNAAVAAVLARQPVAAATAPVLTGALDAEIDLLLQAAAQGDWPEFGEELGDAAIRTLPSATAPQKTELRERSKLIASLQEVGGPKQEIYTIPGALSALAQLHKGAQQIDGFDVSAGIQYLAHRIRQECTRYLTDALSPGSGAAAIGALQELLAGAVTAIHDGGALLALELDGTVDRLVGLRVAFIAATEREQRVAIGKQIGDTARRALLLDKAGKDARAGQLLLDTVDKAMGKIRAADATSAAGEDATMGELGDGLDLLGLHTADLTASPLPAGSLAPQFPLPPELAFPGAVDRADEKMQGDLADRMTQQSHDVAAARAGVIPAGRELTDLAAAHKRWWGFYSQEQEKLDSMGHIAWELIEGLFDGPLGLDTGDPYISIQQGFGRAMMMPLIAQGIGGGQTFDFVGDLRKQGVHRSSQTSGSASSPRYEFAETFGPGGGRSGADERQSRMATSSNERTRTSNAMNVVAGAAANVRPVVAAGLGMAGDSSVPITGAKPTTPEEGWSYLTDVYDETEDAVHPPLASREHKVIAPEVVEYLLAREQQIATLQQEHIPRAPGGAALGGPRKPGAKGQGLESGSGMAAEMYLQGAPEGGIDPTAARLQGARTAGLEQTGAGKRGGDPAVRAMQMLVQELSKYLDDWFLQHREPEYRIAAVLAIAQTEHDIKADFKQFMEAGELAKMIGKAVAIASALSVLSMLGPLGRLASMAIGAWLRSQGVSDITAMISVAAFLKQSAEASTLHEARGWALIGRSAAKDMASILENVVTSPFTSAVEHLGKGSTPREVGDAIAPLIASDPATRKRMLEAVDHEIAQIEKAHPNESNPDKEALFALRDQLHGTSTMEGQLGADMPLSTDRDKPKGMELLTGPATRSATEWTALREAIGDKTVPIVENPDLPGRTVQVRYDDNGVTHVEIGRTATPEDVGRHAHVVRTLRSYEGPVGRIRKLLSRILSTLQLTPGFGDKGFEARHEIKKLRAIQGQLEVKEKALAKRLEALSERDPARVQKELDAIGREMEGVEAQLKGWEESVDSFEKGRGIIAAVDTSGSEGPRDYRIVQVTPRRVRGRGWLGIPDVIPKGTIFQFPGGERVWRTKDGNIVVESTLDRGTGRRDYEGQLPSRGDYDDQGFRDALYERAHSQGQGTGFESPFGIRLAPWVVNQRLQRYGIEEYLYRLRDVAPAGTDFQVVTNTKTRERTLRMESIEYSIWVTQNGQRKRLFEFEIALTGEDAGTPRVELPHDKIWVNGEPELHDFAEHIDMDDIHGRFRRALADMLRDGRPD